MLEKLLNTLDPFYSPYTLILIVVFLAILFFSLSWTDVFMKDEKKVYKKVVHTYIILGIIAFGLLGVFGAKQLISRQQKINEIKNGRIENYYNFKKNDGIINTIGTVVYISLFLSSYKSSKEHFLIFEKMLKSHVLNEKVGNEPNKG